jgi:hypothetical protein
VATSVVTFETRVNLEHGKPLRCFGHMPNSLCGTVLSSTMVNTNSTNAPQNSNVSASENLLNADQERWRHLMRDPQLAALATLMAVVNEMPGGPQYHRYPYKNGVGFAAEDVNALIDEFSRRQVIRTGHLNERNGPDRIVDGIPVQTKYFAAASKTFAAAFDQDGFYRYGDIQLEVPKDQYEECLRRMRQAISDGRVPGVSDPDMAEEFVRRGQVTFAQARNIARFGTIESVKFDAVNQAVEIPSILGLTFMVEYAMGVWSNRGEALTDPDLHRKMLKSALRNSFKTSMKSYMAGMLTRQVLRTRAAPAGTVAVRGLLRSAHKTQLGKDAIRSLASLSGQSLRGGAAINWVSKVLRTNVITGTAIWLVQCTPDAYRASVEKSISWQQGVKNAGVSAAGIAGGTGGAYAGALFGAAIGSIVPGVGTVIGGAVGGVIGSLTIGIGSQQLAQVVANTIQPDDAVLMFRIVQQTLIEVAEEHCVLSHEFDLWIEPVSKTVTPNWLRSMFATGDDQARKAYVVESFLPALEQILRDRLLILTPSQKQLQEAVEELSSELINHSEEES